MESNRIKFYGPNWFSGGKRVVCQNSKGANVPQTFRCLIYMKQKNHWVISRICLIEGDPFYFAQENRFWTKFKQFVFNKRNLGTISKRFGFVSKTISERLSFRFWHYYKREGLREREREWKWLTLAVWKPMPELAPVTRATWPLRSRPCSTCRAVELASNLCLNNRT